jgi:TetR/AcrR family transcriptional regulator
MAAPTVPLSSRDKILDVAEALFAQRGFAGVGMREVAEHAGLGKSSLFHHFRSKTELYLEVLGRVIAGFRERLEPVLLAATDPADKLDRALDTIIDALAEQPTTARLLLRSIFEDDQFPPEFHTESQATEAEIHELLDSVGAVITAGVETGVFRPVSVPHMLQSLIGLTVYHFASGELGEEVIGRPLLSAEAVRERKEQVRQLLHHGLASPRVRPTQEAS